MRVTWLGERRAWKREMATTLLAGGFLGLLGPFGSYLNGHRLVVLAYWMVALLSGGVLFGLVVRPSLRLAPWLRMPPALVLLGATSLAAIPLSLSCHALARHLWPGAIGRIGALTWYGQTLLISLPLALCYLWSAPEETARAAIETGQPPVLSVTDFLSRLPASLGGELLALQMEDHYVRAHTTRGSALILISLSQAMGELGGRPGVRTHRSWWVARDAVAGTFHDGRNLRLRLRNGLDAPVSRANVAAARQAGLLDRLG